MHLLNLLELKIFVSFLIDPGEMYKKIPRWKVSFDQKRAILA